MHLSSDEKSLTGFPVPLNIFAAVRAGTVKACQDAVAHNKKCIASRDHLGRSPMFIAASRGHTSVCKWLAEVGEHDVMGLVPSPLYAALERSNLETAEWLIMAGAANDIKGFNKELLLQQVNRLRVVYFFQDEIQDEALMTILQSLRSELERQEIFCKTILAATEMGYHRGSCLSFLGGLDGVTMKIAEFLGLQRQGALANARDACVFLEQHLECRSRERAWRTSKDAARNFVSVVAVFSWVALPRNLYMDWGRVGKCYEVALTVADSVVWGSFGCVLGAMGTCLALASWASTRAPATTAPLMFLSQLLEVSVAAGGVCGFATGAYVSHHVRGWISGGLHFFQRGPWS